MNPGAWRKRAACRREEPELFCAPQTAANTAKALAVCRACPVQADCRDEALTAHIEYGIWGGLTEDDRQAIWRQDREEATT